MALIGWTRRLRLGSWRHQQEMLQINAWQQAIRDWQQQVPELAVLAADAGRLIKGYGRVRDLAIADLRLFLTDALPLLQQIKTAGGDALGCGKKALALIATEAGKGEAGLTQLRAEVETLNAATAA
jgi:indolepyruvate ferredoxin oxidoreductase beta subunit